MLYEIPRPHLDQINALLKEADPTFRLVMGDCLIEKIQDGVYDGGFNLSNWLNAVVDGDGNRLWKINDYTFADRMRAAFETSTQIEDWRSDYVVADDVDQVLAYWGPEVDDPGASYVIGATAVERNAGKGGGWRWHKWGEYIGDRSPQCEYLNDEPEIDRVICARLYQIEEVA